MKTPPAGLARKLVAASDSILVSGTDVRLEQVATDLGVARTTLYYYFSGREDLLAFLLAEHLREGAEVIAAATSGDDPPTVKLHRVIAALLGFIIRHPGLCTGLLASLGTAAKMDEVLAANDALIAAPVRDLVAAGIAAGELREADPADVASALLGATLFVVVGRAARGEPITDTDADQLAAVILTTTA